MQTMPLSKDYLYPFCYNIALLELNLVFLNVILKENLPFSSGSKVYTKYHVLD